MTAPFSDLVVVHRATVTGRDELGDDIVTTVDLQYPAVVAPSDGNSTTGDEATDFRDTVTSGLTAYLPYDADVTATDTVTALGVEWQIVGVPMRWRNPFTGSAPGCTVALRRVTG